MTREEAIRIIETVFKDEYVYKYYDSITHQALNMAIEALSAEAEWIPREHFDVLKKNYDMLARLLEDAKARALGAWIPCSERLPETHTEYVTENPWTQVSIVQDTYQLSDPVLGYGKRKHHSDGDPMMAVVWYEDDGYDRTGWITAPDCEDIDVIAWMPLPEPYREDGEA